MRRPGDAVHARTMVVQSSDGRARYSNVENDDLHGIDGECSEIVRVLFVPGESQQRVMLSVFVDDGRVLEMPEVEHSNGAVGADGREHVAAASASAEGDIVDFFVVSNELSADVSTDGIRSADRLTCLRERRTLLERLGPECLLRGPIWYRSYQC